MELKYFNIVIMNNSNYVIQSELSESKMIKLLIDDHEECFLALKKTDKEHSPIHVRKSSVTSCQLKRSSDLTDTDKRNIYTIEK